MWQRNLPSVDGSAGNAHASCCCRCVTAQLLPSGTPPGPPLSPLYVALLHAATNSQRFSYPNFVSCAHLSCTPRFPTFVLDGRLQNLRTNSDETLQQEFSSEDLCIWRAQNCRVLLLDTRLAAAAAAESRVHESSSRGPRENLSANLEFRDLCRINKVCTREKSFEL
jgi:hypothetical protein